MKVMLIGQRSCIGRNKVMLLITTAQLYWQKQCNTIDYYNSAILTETK